MPGGQARPPENGAIEHPRVSSSPPHRHLAPGATASDQDRWFARAVTWRHLLRGRQPMAPSRPGAAAPDSSIRLQPFLRRTKTASDNIRYPPATVLPARGSSQSIKSTSASRHERTSASLQLQTFAFGDLPRSEGPVGPSIGAYPATNLRSGFQELSFACRLPMLSLDNAIGRF